MDLIRKKLKIIFSIKYINLLKFFFIIKIMSFQSEIKDKLGEHDPEEVTITIKI